MTRLSGREPCSYSRPHCAVGGKFLEDQVEHSREFDLRNCRCFPHARPASVQPENPPEPLVNFVGIQQRGGLSPQDVAQRTNATGVLIDRVKHQIKRLLAHQPFGLWQGTGALVPTAVLCRCGCALFIVAISRIFSAEFEIVAKE